MGKTILIAEQSEIIRKGLIKVINSFDMFDNVSEIACNTNIEASVIRLEPDILVINPLMINTSLKGWLKEHINGKMKVAAIVYTLLDDEFKEVFDDIIQINDTRLRIKAKLTSLISSKTGSKAPLPDDTLSSREKDVVRLLAKGLSNKEISEQLYISPHTVITHRKNITRKLNIKSVAGLIVYAIINEIVSVDDLHNQ
jgi:DNA-binding NarL/FixJ family response regulator